MHVRDLDIRPLDLGVVAALLVAAELAVALGSPDGPTLALYLFPVAWSLPFLLHRTLPSVAALAMLGALALESFVAQEATESTVVLIAVVLAFWSAGTVPDRGRAVAVGIAGVLLGIVVVARNPGPIGAGDVGFIAIVSTLPFAAGMALRSREQHAEELRRRATELEREREQRARAAVDEERARIARERHDVVGPAVGLLTVQAGAARLVLDTEPDRARESLLAVEAAGRQALAEMRRLLMVLRTDGDSEELGPQPGISDLPALVAQVREAGLPVELMVDGDAAAVTPGLDLAAYRVVQEALTNVRRHAGEAPTVVHVRYAPDGLRLLVENDGPALPTAPTENGQGLVGMRERVSLYGGEVDAGPRPEGGFAVRIHLPISPETA